jgi:hypothetical protein
MALTEIDHTPRSSYPVLVFERFTDRARRIVLLALDEARLLGHDHIGSEHILLGLTREGDTVAAKVLESLDISLTNVRSEIEEAVGRGASNTPSGHIPFTPQATKVLELSRREALQLDDASVDTQHILLGLIREGEGLAAQVLVKLGADLSRTRQQVLRLRPDDAARIRPLLVQRAIDEDLRWNEARWSTRAEGFLMRHSRYVPNFLFGWPTWFGNRKAGGLRGVPGDLAYLKDTLLGRHRDK